MPRIRTYLSGSSPFPTRFSALLLCLLLAACQHTREENSPDAAEASLSARLQESAAEALRYSEKVTASLGSELPSAEQLAEILKSNELALRQNFNVWADQVARGDFEISAESFRRLAQLSSGAQALSSGDLQGAAHALQESLSSVDERHKKLGVLALSVTPLRLPLLIARLARGNPQAQELGQSIRTTVTNEETLEKLSALVVGAEKKLRAQLAPAVVKLAEVAPQSEAIFRALITLARDPDDGVRIEAARGLAFSQHQNAAHVLAQLQSEDPSPEVRAEALFAQGGKPQVR